MSRRYTEKIIKRIPAIAEPSNSLPALALPGSPAEVITKNPAKTMSIKESPPPTPIAQGRTNLRNSVMLVTTIQPTAVLMPFKPFLAHSVLKVFLSNHSLLGLVQQKFKNGHPISDSEKGGLLPS